MSDIKEIIGKRIRTNRERQSLTQEKLAELSGLHSSYIGQLERGERNATIVTLLKVTSALNITISKLLENIEIISDESVSEEDIIPLYCFKFLAERSKSEQKKLLSILKDVSAFNSDD